MVSDYSSTILQMQYSRVAFRLRYGAHIYSGKAGVY